MKIIRCKITNKEFKDIENKNGCITEHLKKLNINVPTAFIRRQFLKNNGHMWHMQFFNIIEIIDKETKKCKYCDWTTVDLENKSGQYTIHLKEKHNTNINQYINEFPEEKKLFTTHFLKEIKTIEKESSIDNYVVCKICNEKLKYITNTHLNKHNISPENYKEKFPNEQYASNSYIKKTKTILKNASVKIIKSFESKPEKNLKKFLEKDLSINIIKNDKKLLHGIEIDVLIPKFKIAIEFNGNLYHSENYGGKNKFFHLDKTEKCKIKNYKLVHIFEDEWFLKNEIVKSKLKHLLGFNISLPTIHSRKCVIKKISATEKNLFLENNHIQGQDMSTIYLGAFFNNELVSVMTFDNKRKMAVKNNQSCVFELKRFSTNIHYVIPGMFSKLLKHFITHYKPTKIISFADRRWTINDDNLYTKSGFKLSETLAPDYTYYNSKKSRYRRFHKFGFGKNSIKKKFPEVYHPDKTEWEMMQELGYDRIWDCGKFRYEMEI